MKKSAKGATTRDEVLKWETLAEELESEKAITFFAASLITPMTVDQALWGVAKNCISQLNFVYCVVYWIDRERNILVPKAAYDAKSQQGDAILNPVEIPVGRGVVGSVAVTGLPQLSTDTPENARRLAEIAVPILCDGTVVGVIKAEHSNRKFVQPRHLKILTTVAALCAQKLKQVAVEQAYQQAERQLMETNKRIAETKLLALRMQMNPHFIYNSLSSINSFILQNNAEQASDLLTKFSRLMRQVLENSRTDWVSLRLELKALHIYLELEQLRCNRKFEVRFEVDANIDQDIVRVPPLLIQPYVDNAIWHGLLPMKERPPVLQIRCRQEQRHLIIEIHDNGIGRVASAQLRSNQLRNHKEEGGRLLAERLQLLNEMYDVNARFAIIDQFQTGGQPAGTCVNFTLKLPPL